MLTLTIFFTRLNRLTALIDVVFSIDKAMHSKGYKIGYALAQRKLPNPVDIALVFCQLVRTSDSDIECHLP